MQDAGAYPGLGAFLPFMTRTMASGVYDIPTVQFNAKSVVTNTTPTVAYRGAGRPEATAAIERAMDLFAAEIGMDPVEVRRRNLVAADAFPYTTPTGTVYDGGDYERASTWPSRPPATTTCGPSRPAGATPATPCSSASACRSTSRSRPAPRPARSTAGSSCNADGTATVFTGASSHGQGHDTASPCSSPTRSASRSTMHGRPRRHRPGAPEGVGTFGSRSLQLGGSAIHEASGQVVDKARRSPPSCSRPTRPTSCSTRASGAFHVAGTPAVSRSWAEVAAAAGAERSRRPRPTSRPTAPTFPFGAHVAVVEVDTETGLVRLVRIVTCDDAGRILNPLLVEGQRHGGIAQGVAQALYEEVRYDDDGNPLTANLADYAMISAAELPQLRARLHGDADAVNPLGAKGIGESGTIGSTPAVQSAVCDALAPFGVRHVDMPCTPERVWQAIRSARH